MYKILFLITCHESKECVGDLIQNIFKFNEDACIILMNGIQNDSLEELKSHNVHVIQRSREYDNANKYFSMIPLHVEMWDYAINNNIQCEYVITLSSNQLFIRHNLYSFMRCFEASLFPRLFPADAIDNSFAYSTYNRKYINEIGKEYFKYQSNHDGMFYKSSLFSSMMNYFVDNRGQLFRDCTEELLYPAWLLKNVTKDNLVEFSQYNFFYTTNYDLNDVNSIWNSYTLQSLDTQKIIECINKGFYIVKRINRNYDDEARQYVRQLQ